MFLAVKRVKEPSTTLSKEPRMSDTVTPQPSARKLHIQWGIAWVFTCLFIGGTLSATFLAAISESNGVVIGFIALICAIGCAISVVIYVIKREEYDAKLRSDRAAEKIDK